MQVKAIIKYKTFRKDFKKTIVELTKDDKLKNNPELYNKLQTAYNSTKKEYDGFLVVIKSDMSDYRAVKQMAKKPQIYAQKYMDVYTNALNNYETNFLPVYNEILSKTGNSRTISPILIKLAIDGFSIIVNYIKKRKANKTESYNLVLAQINKLFFNKLKLREWEELVSYTSNNKVSNNNLTKENNKTYVPYPTISEMKSEIEFVYVTQKNPVQTDKMLFSHKNAERDLIVGNLTDTTNYSGDYFISQNAYPEKTAFQINVTNTAFMYVFAFNTNDKCYNIYPFSKEWIKACNMNRDLEVGTLPGRDDNTMQTIIPSKTQNGKDNYIIISGRAEKERLCIIISKSELNIQDVYKKIDNLQGTIYERINAVFVNNIILEKNAGVITNSNKITFDASKSNKTILPLIFYIKR